MTFAPYPKPARRVKQPPAALQRSEWGAKRRASEHAEKKFQARVEELAQYLGWYPWHLYHAQRSKAGFPDLVLWRERTVWAELKATSRLTGRTGKLTPEQEYFRDMIQAAGGEWYLWTDSTDDWNQLCAVLSNGGTVTVDPQAWRSA